ncbi:MAG: membrane protein insertion efficiency factor YidD, partial [Oscillospiraceae bacterium]|nr:membrane protein insertion efficiency factor YidD [Oscillospiraceae bacterium]
MKKFLIGFVNFYRRRISPLRRSCCRFEPTCS